jgi:hypothetical protein
MSVWNGMAIKSSIARARHDLPFWALQAATPKTAVRLFQGWPPIEHEEVGHGRPLQYSRESMPPLVIRPRLFPKMKTFRTVAQLQSSLLHYVKLK